MKKNSKKMVALLLALCLLIGGVVGGTIAYLVDKTNPVVNTFTTSDVDIELKENTGTEYKMVPGATIAKDPTVTVKSGSEACYVFVKVDAVNTTNYISYSIAEDWTLVDGQSNIYYKTVDAATAATGTSLPILAGNQVTVLSTVTKADMTEAEAAKPTLTFTAYAIQQEGFSTPEAAWAEASKLG